MAPPLTGRTEYDCFRQFETHISDLFAATLNQGTPLRVRAQDDRGTLSFVNPWTVPLKTKFGPLYLYVGQTLLAVRVDRKTFRLKTASYKYTLQTEAGLGGIPMVRWESGHGHANEYCDRHVHVAASVPRSAPSAPVPLEDLHLPTGRVIIEDLLRFLFADLEVEPARSDWSTQLSHSENLFRTELAETPW